MEIEMDKSTIIVNVQNAEGDADTTAEIVVQNQINYTPKVSVIIPVYNVEQYLRQCLDSVVNQTLREIEIICVDDGSTDSSLEILKEYASLDKRITVLKQENLHAGIARNAGLAVAKGEYLNFLDSDDFFELKMLEEMYNKAKTDNSDIVVCGYCIYDQQLFKDTLIKHPDKSLVLNSPIKPEEFDTDLFEACFPTPWSKIFKRDLLIKNKLHFENLKNCNDFTCIMTAVALSSQISCIDKSFIHYRYNTGSQTSTNRFGRNECFIKAAAALEKNLQQFNLYDAFYEKLRYEMDSCLHWETKNNIALLQDFAKKHLSPRLYNDLYVEYICPKVSVIIPVYNVEKYLPKCLDSVVNQTLKDIEIICINDGSTDNSPTILKNYAANDKRIKIINQKNAGQGTARNNGIKQASGAYLYFVDSDDWIDETCLEKLYKRISECGADLCIYGIYAYEEATDTVSKNSYYNLSCYGDNINNICTYTYKELIPVILRRFGPFFKLYKTSWFKENNLYFAEGMHFEDVITHVKSMILAGKICFCNENLYYYRVNRQGSTMNINKSIIHTQDIQTFIMNTYNFLQSQNLLPIFEYEFAKFMFEQLMYHYTRVTDIDVKEQFVADIRKFVDNNFADLVIKYTDIQAKYNQMFLPIGVSIVVAAYNAEQYIAECLDSLIGQTQGNIEIICVNDGSEDNTLKIIKQYAAKDNRLKIINQENQGLSVSRNNALQIARGRYVVFVDADDYLKPNAIEKIFARMELNNLDMLSYSGVNFDNDTREEHHNSYWDFHYLPKNFNTQHFNWKDAKSFMQYMAVSSCLTAYRLSFIKSSDLQFPPHLRFEDNLFFAKAVTRAQRVGITRDKFYMRRIHSGEITQNWNAYFADYMEIASMVCEYFQMFDTSLVRQYVVSYGNSIQTKYQNMNDKEKKQYKGLLDNFFKKWNYSPNLKSIPLEQKPQSQIKKATKQTPSQKNTAKTPKKDVQASKKNTNKTPEKDVQASKHNSDAGLEKQKTSYILFNFIPFFARKQRGGNTLWTFLGLRVWRVRKFENNLMTKYYLFGIPFIKISHK